MKNLLESIYESFKGYIVEKRYGMLAVMSAAIVVALSAAALCGWLLFQHFELIVTGLCVIGVAKVWAGSKLQSPPPIVAPEPERKLQPDPSITKRNYDLVGLNLLIINQEMPSSFHLSSFTSPSQIEAPKPIIEMNGFQIMRYVFTWSGTPVDPSTIKAYLQERFNSKLYNMEISGINQVQHVFEGMGYPIIQVHDVVDQRGYIEIDLVWASDSYFQYLKAKKLANLGSLGSPAIPRDKDF